MIALWFWRLVRALGEGVIASGYAIHWYARQRIAGIHGRRIGK